MNVATKIIERFGGSAKLARLLGHKWPSRVNNWKVAGHIPAGQQPLVLQAAKDAGVKLAPKDFFEDA